MDPGDYETNTLLINNVSSVAYKIYEPVVSQSSPYTFAASDVEYTLRKGGHLVYADPLRRAVWCFSLTTSDSSAVPEPVEPALRSSFDVGGYNLALVEEGSHEPINLLRNRISGPNALSTPSSSSPSGPGLDAALRNPGANTTPASSTTEADAKASSSSTGDSKGYGSIPAKEIHEFFINSVLASLSHSFCSKTSAVPLDSKSFILPAAGGSADSELPGSANVSTIATLRVHMTTMGSLLIGISLNFAPGICATHDGFSPPLPINGSTVVAAPFGVFGTFKGLSDDGDNLSVDDNARSPDLQLMRFGPDVDGRSNQWRSSCCKFLEMRGISSAVLSRSSWLSIQFLRRKPNESRTDGKRTPVVNPQTYVMWPAVLCYRKRSRNPIIPVPTVESGARTGKEGFDALNNAKAWFTDNGEREQLISEITKEREATILKDVREADPRLLQSGTSPHAPRRTSNTGGAGSAMYPTPPDGVQMPAGVTPSIDGTTSSPGNPGHSVALVDVDTTMVASSNLGDAFGDSWDGTESKRDQSFNQENWELNNDVFVENDITDADFNFFDEQPDAMGVSVLEFPDMSSGLSHVGNSNHPPTQESQKPPEHTAVKLNSPQPPPVFAKPELKHARSSLGESRNRDNMRARPPNGLKRQPSPFDPATVFKKLKASLGPELAVNKLAVRGPGRRGSAFDKLDFDRSFTVVNKKYEHNGRFDYERDQSEENEPRNTGSPPTTNYLRRHGKSRAIPKELPSNLGTQIARITGAMESNNNVQNDHSKVQETSDADDISLVSDQDDVSDFSDEPSSPVKLGIRRRRLADDNESLAPSIKDIDIMDEQIASGSVDISKLSLNEPPEVPVSRYFAEPEPIPPRGILSDDEYIMVAQILTEQAVSGCLNYATLDSTHANLGITDPRRDIVNNTRNSLQTLQKVLPSCLKAATGCQLRQLIEVQDVPLLAAPSRMPHPRPPAVGGSEQRPSLVQITPPHLELRRHDTKLSVLPSAVTFWEILGLGPSQGPKDIHSVCVFPNLEGISESAGIFLDRMRTGYESLKLGSFERMPSSATIPNGLLPFEVDKTNNTPVAPPGSRSGQPLIDDMAKLAVAIFNSTAVSRNFVIFFVYTPENPGTIVESCLAFQRMFELYKRAVTDRKKPVQNDLVLQLVPLNYVATSTTMVVLPPYDCIRMCLEVYDRCTLFGGPMPAPAIVLEQQPITQGINFQLRTQPSANILQENSCMHIAYAQSVDERWITAAWTDNRGSKQMTASYCLGRKGKPLSRSFTDVAHEIWTTTHDLTSIWKVHWRIIITKVGHMDQHEISDWTTLAQTEIKSSVTLSLMTVDTNPSLQLIPAIPKVSIAAQSAFYSTPVSTPQPSTMSPEQVGNPTTPKGGLSASTPGADNNATDADADANLVDVTDTTWGVILSHRLNTSHSLTDSSQALTSGYLIRRGGSRAEDPPAVMEINVVHCDNLRMHEVLLREMLSVFRGLGTIARARSVTDKDGDVRPWHVAAAEKGSKALYLLM